MIVFDRVGKQYPNGHQALAEVSVEIDRGEMVFLTGRSGAGKSTLLKLIMLMERATTGEVFVADQNLNTFSKSGIPYLRRQIGVVFQNHQLLFDRTVFDNVALPLKIAGFDRRDIERRVRAALAKVGLENFEKHSPMNLSGGEQQRVGIARAVVNRPKILLADEPTGNLDPALSADVMDIFRQFSQVGVTTLIASHDLALIARLQHRTLTLQDGRLFENAEVSRGLNGN
ncbi:MAG: cell division ATP-binding protein FtsE [Pseudomonadales bacterium]